MQMSKRRFQNRTEATRDLICICTAKPHQCNYRDIEGKWLKLFPWRRLGFHHSCQIAITMQASRVKYSKRQCYAMKWSLPKGGDL
jgi:hypothetical protein